jgi:DNA-binding GntR family transcriptional regulator
VDRAYHEVRTAILNRDLLPGSRLVEAQLAEELGVSRLPVREALIQLESEGLAVRIPGRGKVVASLSAADVSEVYTLRAAVETLAFRLAKDHVTSTDQRSLERLIANMEEAATEGDVRKLAALDVRFHEQIVRLSHHRRALAVWRTMTVQMQLLSLRVIDTLYRDLAVVPDHHRALLDALLRGEEPTGLDDHIMSVAHHILSQLSADHHTDGTPANAHKPVHTNGRAGALAESDIPAQVRSLKSTRSRKRSRGAGNGG